MPGQEIPRPHSLGVLLRLCHQQFLSAVDSTLADSGFGDIRPHHANVFTFVPKEGIQVSELAHKAGVRKQTMAQVVEELERLGYVKRCSHPTDLRARLVMLTERGQKIRPLAMNAGKKVEESWELFLGTAKMTALRETLQEVLGRDEVANPESNF